MRVSAFAAVLLVAVTISSVEPHGHLFVPLPRNSLWRDPNFPQQPPNYNDQQVWCDNAQNDLTYSLCGVCGDGVDAPQDHMLGGLYGLGLIAANYTSGSQIEITTQLQASHQGHIEMHLCDSDIETEECFQKHGKLVFTAASEPLDSTSTELCVPYDNGGDVYIYGTLQLPQGVTCDRCTLRWTYRTSYPPNPLCGPNPNPTQIFRNCADVRIH